LGGRLGGFHRVRQDDTATYRLWEVAGAAHIGAAARVRSVARQEREFGGSVPEPWVIPDDPNALSMDPVYDAALHHLQRWITEGTPPPSLPRMEVSGSPRTIVRDELGNAVGGVRLPELEVPTATHLGASEPGHTPNLFGRSIPFDPEVSARLYPDEDSHRRQFDAAVRQAEAAGFILPRDAAKLLGQ
jgi:Alpha/beta hydrolase domain